MPHLTVEALLENIETMAVAGDATGAGAHLATCGRCREQAKELQELIHFLSEDIENEPPREVLEWGLQLFQPVLRPRPRAAGRILQIARRVFDSYEQPLEGIRNLDTAGRQLLYRAGNVDVDVRVEPVGEGRISLAGQFLSESESFPESTAVRLESGGAVRFTTSTNAVGEFSFDDVPEATYHLTMDVSGGELRLFCVHQEPLSR